MLTLAFSQMFYAYAFQAAWLGAEDGVFGVPRPSLIGLNLAKPTAFHLYLVALDAVCARIGVACPVGAQRPIGAVEVV